MRGFFYRYSSSKDVEARILSVPVKEPEPEPEPAAPADSVGLLLGVRGCRT